MHADHLDLLYAIYFSYRASKLESCIHSEIMISAGLISYLSILIQKGSVVVLNPL